jgi:putative ABC transport system ATP-binding protein
VAVAVAPANGPLADEPTSRLDHASAAVDIELIRAANEDLVVTHDPAVGAAVGRTITIRDGRVCAEAMPGRMRTAQGLGQSRVLAR